MSDTAILVIDVQIGVVQGSLRAARLDSVLDNLNLAIAMARQRGYPVIVIQHEEDGLEADSADWQLHPALAVTDSDIRIRKCYGDSFCDTGLAAVLKQHGIRTLWVGGCATDFCVDSTVRNAVSHGYQVSIISDAHTTVSAFALSGEQVIDHFNAVWRATRATPQPLRVVPASQL